MIAEKIRSDGVEETRRARDGPITPESFPASRVRRPRRMAAARARVSRRRMRIPSASPARPRRRDPFERVRTGSKGFATRRRRFVQRRASFRVFSRRVGIAPRASTARDAAREWKSIVDVRAGDGGDDGEDYTDGEVDVGEETRRRGGAREGSNGGGNCKRFGVTEKIRSDISSYSE